ncbi:four-carbon acid sugar kinase family protein [Polynucleobacter sp. AP-Jannik-300A-C4]|uniref:3-oxo-tetronate kinase n=1 Tax=Polynucleobacter sp. AP-Jannik-300A-C4 TaxID=2576928 RepID=UPI001BFE06A2|nr:3-oxo-tetronate kinase [Polynucleobacter sp. AP-Jannik-300A-C4]QWE23146.1 four-carbon acid sugar kinase family protein [Polynucleobacter sp. AP-Jannik-300A-C4]
MSILLGCIADDFTGATDLANNLVRNGMRVAQTIGIPQHALNTELDAVVVALKSRNIEPEAAIAQSLEALEYLLAQGAQQIFFKYCSTFDSTPKGNIGPVTEALMAALGADFTIATPAFPDNGRSVFKGYLFVGDQLLSESGMRDHPLTPMTDANLVRVMQAQCQNQVGLIEYQTILAGADAISSRIADLKASNAKIAIVDAVTKDDLYRIAPALKDLPLITGGSGIAIGLPSNFGLQAHPTSSQLPPASGYRAIVSGSCSQATNLQVERFKSLGGEMYVVNPLELNEKSTEQMLQEILTWAKPRLPHGSVLIYSSASPDQVKEVQSQLGVQAAGSAIENLLGSVAKGLVALGVGQLLVAGGETSGACVKALGIDQMQIGQQIDPGVPWCYAKVQNKPLHLALKSGNFGAADFFTSAFSKL